MILAVIWALYLGQLELGPYPSLHACQADAAWYLTVKHEVKLAACVSGKTVVRFNEKQLPANLRSGKK